MSDDPTPAPAPATPATDPAAQPAMSVAEATSRRDEMINDPAFRDRYLNGDAEAAKEMARVTAALATPEVKPGDASMDAQVAGLRAITKISPELETQIRERPPITPAEREATLALKDNLYRDQAWVARFHAGDTEAIRQAFLISVNLSSPVRDPVQP
jgi:hypothetical protein